ncbi:MAG TPA: class I SAM-dependent methyltransferase [Candidatus Eisenbacteria bacterium]|uniref:Class I SAM-dependent methyltransferase n=1 Tax=Eiseniibacteriota bacterium TaxID=2212470 RepID=A0A7V2ATM4_UNCEI|nr:class I SAM-dependent methyltransferase [Candidatus Eisenbacteria bacterium]
MAERVCPWWMGYFLLGPFRKISENPRKILAPFVENGMKVLEPGCGMGFFTLEAARLAGPQGRVYAIDLQPRMISALKRRVRRAGLSDVVEARLCPAETLGVEDLAGSIDLALALFLVHEVPDPGAFFREMRQALRPGGKCLIVEPAGHVSGEAFEATLDDACGAGFAVSPGPGLGKNHTAVLERG